MRAFGQGGWLGTGSIGAQLMKHMSMILLVGMAVTRIVSTFAIVKLISEAFGPEAFGALSHVIGVSAVFYMFAGGGLANGLIRNVAASEDPASRGDWLRAASVISTVTALALGAFCLVCYLWGGAFILLDPELAPVFLLIAVTQAVIGLGNAALAFLSGIGRIGSFAAANALGSLAAEGLVAGAVQLGGLWGAFLAVATLPLVPSLLGVVLLGQRFRADVKWPPTTNRHHIIELLKFSGAALLAIVAVPVVQAFMRVEMASDLGWESVGHWQAIARISDAYMQIFGVLFINLLLPHLARASSETRRLVALRMGGVFVGLYLAGTIVYYLLREQIILIAFSPDFLPATNLLVTQSIGDLCKIGSWIIVYTYVAGGLLRFQVGAELAQAALTGLVFVLLAPLGSDDVAVTSHAIACAAVLFGLGIVALMSRYLPSRASA